MLAENHFVFRMSRKNNLVFVWLVLIELISLRGIEYDLISVWHEINFVAVWVVELTWFLNTGRKSLDFSVISLSCILCVVQIDLISV